MEKRQRFRSLSRQYRTGARFAWHPRFVSEKIGRRAFLARAIVIGAICRTRAAGRRSAPVLRIGVVTRGVGDGSPALLGARLGAEEASHSAALFGAGSVEVTVGSMNEVLAHNVVALLASEASTEDCLHLASVAGERGTLFFNTNCADDSLRGEHCQTSAFHVAPSRAMSIDAVDEAGRQAGAQLPKGTAAVAWDPSLERFGADTLNNRFRNRFNTPMTAEAWCAWFAVKAIGEASLRTHSADAKAIAAYLRSATAQFDGHKGRPLSFRAWDNQLRQPVYVVAPSANGRRLIAESPAAVSASATSREVLDRIGTTATSTTCRFAP